MLLKMFMYIKNVTLYLCLDCNLNWYLFKSAETSKNKGFKSIDNLRCVDPARLLLISYTSTSVHQGATQSFKLDL